MKGPELAKTVKNASYTFVVTFSAQLKALIRDFKSFSLMFASTQGSDSRLNRSKHSSRLIFSLNLGETEAASEEDSACAEA